MNEKLISVIVPMHNASQYLEMCLESIYSQKNVLFEVILVDDGSTDNTRSICEKWGNKNSNLKYIYQRNLGPSEARNIGIEQAIGDYLYFMDSDDTIDSNYLNSFLKDTGNFDLCIGNYKMHQEQKITSFVSENIKSRELNTSDIMNYIVDPKHNFFGGFIWNKLFKAETVKNKIKFDKKIFYGEDMDFLIRYIIRNPKIITTKESAFFYNYFIRNNSLSTNKNSSKKLSIILAFDNIEKFFKKNQINLTTLQTLKLEVLIRLYKNCLFLKSEQKKSALILNRIKGIPFSLIFNREITFKVRSVFLIIKLRFSWIFLILSIFLRRV